MIIMCQNVPRGICPRKLPGNSPEIFPVKSDSWKHIANLIYICMSSKALWPLFTLCVPAPSVVPHREDWRTHVRLPTKDLTKIKRSGLSWICTFKSGKMYLHFTATTYNLCFSGFIFVGASAIIFALQIFCCHAKSPVEVEIFIEPEAVWELNRETLTSWRLLAPWPLQSILDFKCCNHFSSKCSFLGYWWSWPGCIIHQWRPGEAMVENKGSGDFNMETVTDFFPLCGAFFE